MSRAILDGVWKIIEEVTPYSFEISMLVLFLYAARLSRRAAWTMECTGEAVGSDAAVGLLDLVAMLFVGCKAPSFS